MRWFSGFVMGLLVGVAGAFGYLYYTGQTDTQTAAVVSKSSPVDGVATPPAPTATPGPPMPPAPSSSPADHAPAAPTAQSATPAQSAMSSSGSSGTDSAGSSGTGSDAKQTNSQTTSTVTQPGPTVKTTVTSTTTAVPAGPLLLPVAGIKASQLHDTFNEARGSERRHEALDILAPRGTPVLAVADGKVAKLFDSKPGGLTVYQFDTSEKFAYYYAHLDRYAEGIKEGMQLKRGDLVGYVGTTGNADPNTPHLHFAIFQLGPERQWWKGTPINPYPLLASSDGR